MTGAETGRAVAFLRAHAGSAAIAIAPVRARALLGDSDVPHVPAEHWNDTAVTLPPDQAGKAWRNVLTGAPVTIKDGSIELAQVLSSFPVALLVTV